MEQYDLDKAHKYSSNHKPELEKDNICGCFFCLKIYNPNEIKEWIIANNSCDKKELQFALNVILILLLEKVLDFQLLKNSLSL